MKKILKNNLGMTLIEVLLAVMIFVLMIWTFAPFVASTFKQIAQAGHLHIEIAGDVSIIDGQIADEYFGAASIFPVKMGTDENIDVSGIYLNSGKLHTFYSANTSYISTDDILYEGYGSDDFYTGFYSIGFLPEVSNKKFFKNDHTWIVSLTGADGFEYIIDEEIDVVHQDGNPPGYDKNDIDPAQVDDSAGVFIVASQFPDGVGGNPDKIAYILIVPDQLGLDNTNSPYGLTITSKDKGQTFVDEQIGIEVMLPLYQAVGEDGFERIASHIDYWVDKYTYSDPDYGDDGIVVERLPLGVDFNDVIWYEDATSGLYITVGDGGNIYYRYHQLVWTKVNKGIVADLNKVKRIGTTFVIVGDNGTVLTSSDGMIWGTSTIGLAGANTKNLISVTYGSGLYLIIAEDGTVYTTPDFSSYTEYTAAASGITDLSVPLVSINDMVNTGNFFMAVGDDNYMAVSAVTTNGAAWTIIDPATSIDPPGGHDDFNCVYVYKSMGFVLGQSGQINTFSLSSSLSGWTWSTVRPHSIDGEDLYDMSYSRRAFVVVGEDGKVMYSLNGTTWTDCNTMDGFNLEKDIFAVTGRE